MREAGFTEQRTAPALCSGRITSWCFPSPVTPDGLLQLKPPLFYFTMLYH
ncbi:hypothetical protein R3W88_025656 [Solanum pinnatisectum]|uniref:Uncharacterized protein n=1 Tax=Solanum pinnatisectum TaxID=50273 RepID=A0AAV9M3N7_9SOLN|nr:hypothetical protein R3W88_025656 [Solanum pinnatisectum]